MLTSPAVTSTARVAAALGPRMVHSDRVQAASVVAHHFRILAEVLAAAHDATLETIVEVQMLPVDGDRADGMRIVRR